MKSPQAKQGMSRLEAVRSGDQGSRSIPFGTYGFIVLLSLFFVPSILFSAIASTDSPQSISHQSSVSTSPSLLTQEIRYHAPWAGEVWLVGGINGWQQAPNTMRPPGTIVPDKAMQTPLVRTDNTFTITIRVPSGTVIDYGFLITKTEKGTPVKLWEGGRPFPEAKVDALIEFESTASQVTTEQRQSWLSGLATDLPLVTQEIRYHLEGAGEVSLVGGINGWQPIPEAARPPGTVLKDNKVMHSPMVRKGDTFTTTVRVPPGTGLDFWFLIAMTAEGKVVDIRHEKDPEGRAFAKIVMFDGRIEVQSQWKRRS